MKLNRKSDPAGQRYTLEFSITRQELMELTLITEFELIWKGEQSRLSYVDFLRRLLTKELAYTRMRDGGPNYGDPFSNIFGGQDPMNAFRQAKARQRYQAPPPKPPPLKEPAWCKVLGLDAKAKPAEIKARYRQLAKQYHPDVGGEQTKFQEITKAYEEAMK
jgi:DnaJ-domain-containing protein 1